MLHEAVFRRFGEARARARGIEFLGDNGPEYTSHRFRPFVRALGLIPWHTPRRSPESNGLASAFFGSFKRDYVYQACLETLEEVGRQLPTWIEHDNCTAPLNSWTGKVRRLGGGGEGGPYPFRNPRSNPAPLVPRRQFTRWWRCTQSWANPSQLAIPSNSEIYRENRLDRACSGTPSTEKATPRAASPIPHELSTLQRTGN